MTTLKIGRTDYNWPELGEKNWGDDATRALQALAAEINLNKNSSAQKEQNNVFTAANRFHNAPKTILEEGKDIAVEEEEILTVEDKKFVDIGTTHDILTASLALKSKLNSGLKEITDFLGVRSRPTTSDLFQVSGFSDFFKTLGGVSNSSSNANLLNVINAMIGYIKPSVPIGKIEASYHNSNERFPLLQWEAVGTSDVPPDGNSVWLHNPPSSANWLVAASNNSGWYRPVFSTGIWSVCDGITPLPINPFGQDSSNWGSEAGTLGNEKRKPFFIPDLASTFLQGATAGQQTTTDGDNTMTLTVAQMPSHKHDLGNYRMVGTLSNQSHKHPVDLTTSLTNAGGGGQGDRKSGLSSNWRDWSNPGSHTHTVSGDTDPASHTHTIPRSNNSPKIKELLESDDPTNANENLANMGSGESMNLNNTLKHLPVVYYMKVAE